MKKVKSTTKVRTIDEFEFQIRPITILFTKKHQSNFLIYIQKGAQVLGKIQQQIDGRQVQHRFIETHLKKFRIANDKNLTYQWSIYTFTDQEQQQYLQSTSFNLKNKYQEFIQEFQHFEERLHKIYNEKQKKTQIQQIWKDLRGDFTTKEFQMTCSFHTLKAKITFLISLKSEYDFLYQRWEENKIKNKTLRQTKRRGSLSSSLRTPQVSFLGSEKERPTDSPKVSSQIQISNLNGQNLLLEQIQHKTEDDQKINIRQSQIKILDPEGVDVTSKIPEKFLNHKRAAEDEAFYSKKKTSMLSDIIEESYEGSSNINFNKSNQGQRLKSVDELHEEQQSAMFSPLVKTQTFQSQKHDQMFEIKRTATFRHSPSQEFDGQPQSKHIKTKNNIDSHKQLSFEDQNQNEEDMQISQLRKTSNKSSQILEKEKQEIKDEQEAHKITLKNIIKIVIIVIVLIVSVNIFGKNQGEHRQKRKYKRSEENKLKKISKK